MKEAEVRTECHRPCVAHALRLSRRILHVGLHFFLHGSTDRNHRPGSFSEVVHEDVVTFLGVLPEIEDLGNRRDVAFRSLPAKIGINGKSSGRLTIVTTQIEDGFVISDSGCTRGQFIFGEVEPFIARTLSLDRIASETCRNCQKRSVCPRDHSSVIRHRPTTQMLP